MAGGTQRKRVAVVFGGRSVEHEISILTGKQVLDNIDAELYEALPVYVAHSGRWYTSAALASLNSYKSTAGLEQNLAAATEVTLLPVRGEPGLTVLTHPKERRLVLGARKRPEHLPVDVYFLALHGSFGEDGCIQGLLELADAAYTGCNLLASAISMNKHISKLLVQAAGIAVLPHVLVRKAEALADLPGVVRRVLEDQHLGHRALIVKPCSLGSSVGINTAADRTELLAAITNALLYDNSVLIEPRIADLREINVSVRDGESVSVAVVEVPQTSGVLTYEDKYMSDGAKKKGPQTSGMASMKRRIDPDDLDSQLKQHARDIALRAYTAIGCSGVVRVDLILDQTTNELYFNELNALPGSLSYYTWQASNPSVLFPDLINTMLDTALAREAAQSTLKRDFGFRALTTQAS